MLHGIHEERGCDHTGQYQHHRGQKLRPLLIYNIEHHIEGIISRIDPKQPKHPENPKGPKSHKAGGDEQGQDVGQDGPEIYLSVKGKDEVADGVAVAFSGVELHRGPDPEGIFYDKYHKGKQK